MRKSLNESDACDKALTGVRINLIDMKKMKKFLIGFAVVVFLLVVGSGVFLMYGSYSEGYQVGVISKMAKKGILFKTLEGELSQGFLDRSSTGDGVSSGVATRLWKFSAEDRADLLASMDKAIEQNKRVKLHYKEKFIALPWVGETKNVVFRVEEVL